MGKVVVSQFMTLDGVVEDPGGAEDFDRGGWAFQFERGDGGRHASSSTSSWRPRRCCSAAHLRGLRGGVAVADRRLRRQVQHHAQVRGLRTLHRARVEQLHRHPPRRPRARRSSGCSEQPGGDVLVNGSVQLVRPLLEHDLVDECG